MIRKENGRREIVVTLRGESWIFSLDGLKTWREGPPLPELTEYSQKDF